MFVVDGPLPACIADEMLLLNPAVPTVKTPLGTRLGTKSDEDDPELKRALALSLEEDLEFETDRDLQLALAMSKRQTGGVLAADTVKDGTPVGQKKDEEKVEKKDEEPSPSAGELRRLRASFLDRFETSPVPADSPKEKQPAEDEPEKESS